MRKSKKTLQIELEGLVGEFLASEFQYIRERNDKLEEMIKSRDEVLKEIALNTTLPTKTYTEQDFMALFYIKVRTQQHYRATGRLGSFKSGDKVLYSQKHIDKYIEDNDSEVLKKKLKQANP